MTDEEMETGYARAEFNRLVAKLGRLRGVSHAQALNKIMATSAWRRAGNPDPKYITLAQAKELCSQIERWIERAESAPQRHHRTVSKAPPAPWAREAGQAEKGLG